MVPNGWGTLSASEACNSVSVGVVIKPSQYYVDSKIGVKAFRSANVREGFINDNDWVYFSLEGHENNKKSQLIEGDVLIVRSGYPGTACVVTKEFEGCNAIDIVIARPNKKIIIPEYLCTYINSSLGKGQILNLQGGLAQKHFNVGAFKHLYVNIPPLPEQRKIAQILSTWDKAITTTEKLIETSKQQKKALMQQLLTGKKRLIDPETGKAFEGEWEEKVFSNFFDIGSSKRILQSEWKESGIPFFRTRELVSLANRKPFSSEIFISKELYSAITNKYGKPKPGDFLVSGVGTLGISYLVKESDEFYFKDGNVLWFKSLGNIDSKFFKYCFESDLVQNQIINQTTITTVGTYTITNAKQTKFLCPSNHREQQKIASALTAADKEIELLEAKLAHFKQEKKALMQQLLTGKRRVKVAKSEAA